MKTFRVYVQGINQVHCFDIKATHLFIGKDNPEAVQFMNNGIVVAAVPLERVLVISDGTAIAKVG